NSASLADHASLRTRRASPGEPRGSREHAARFPRAVAERVGSSGDPMLAGQRERAARSPRIDVGLRIVDTAALEGADGVDVVRRLTPNRRTTTMGTTRAGWGGHGVENPRP